MNGVVVRRGFTVENQVELESTENWIRLFGAPSFEIIHKNSTVAGGH